MTKAVTQEGFYHCEGKYDFSESTRDSAEHMGETEEENKMEVDKEEEPKLSTGEPEKTTQKDNKPLNREGEGFGIQGKKKPNVFVAVELDNPEIIQNMQEVQHHACQFDPKLKSNAVPLQKTHVTLLVANVQEEELQKAKAVISKTFRENLSSIVPENQFSVKIKGVDSFGDKVVFAEVDEGKPALMGINEALLHAFENAGFDCDSRYTPHVTLMKVGHIFLQHKTNKISIADWIQIKGRNTKGSLRELHGQRVWRTDDHRGEVPFHAQEADGGRSVLLRRRIHLQGCRRERRKDDGCRD